jgi:hypothetical protein
MVGAVALLPRLEDETGAARFRSTRQYRLAFDDASAIEVHASESEAGNSIHLASRLSPKQARLNSWHARQTLPVRRPKRRPHADKR